MSETDLFAGHRSAPGMAHLRHKAGSAGAQIGAEISTGRLDARTALAVARMCGDVLVEIDPELCEALLADIELAARRAATQKSASKGTKLARTNRRKCNRLSAKDRKRHLKLATKLVREPQQ